MAKEKAETANKDVVSRYLDAINRSDLDALDDLVDADYVDHDPLPGQQPGREGLKAAFAALTGFPDVQFTVEDVIAERDLVVVRGAWTGTHSADFMGVPATGKTMTWTGIRHHRLKDGKVAEGWTNMDLMGLLQQVGVVPSPPAPDPSTIPRRKELTGAPATPEDNRQLMATFIEEVWNKGNFDLADEVFHPDHTSPSAPALPAGADGVKFIATQFRTAFPDYWMKIEHMAAEDDRVAARFLQGGTQKGELMGIPATGKTVEWSESGILRIADGKVVESWYDVDMMSLMQQLGVAG